jgi:hypothetical protein
MYVFEKILAFELGRPSMVWDRDLSGTLAGSVPIEVQHDSDQQFWQASISLANMLHELQERSAKAWRREAWLPQTVEQAIEEKLQTGGELLILLTEWQQNLANDLKYVYSFRFSCRKLTYYLPSESGLRPCQVPATALDQRFLRTTIILGWSP